jgi:hypothetical protein
MKVFGESPPYGHERFELVPVPVGDTCQDCGEAIKDGDTGVFTPNPDQDGAEEPIHKACAFLGEAVRARAWAARWKAAAKAFRGQRDLLVRLDRNRNS